MKNDRDAKLAEVQRIASTEVPAGVPMAQWALAWCLKNPAVTAVIPAASPPSRSAPTPLPPHSTSPDRPRKPW